MDENLTKVSSSFSVLISVYFKENPIFFKTSLESIWDHQTLRPNEIVIVQDGPITLELKSVIEIFARKAPVKTVKLVKNEGLGVALAVGLSCCTFDIIARMDGDDIAYPTRFEEQIKYLEDNAKIDFVGSWVTEFENSISDVISVRKVPENTKKALKFAKHRNPMNHPSVVFRKSAVLIAGNYITFESMEDYSLWIRMLISGSKMYNFQKPLLYFRTSRQMFLRRHGVSYYFKELKFQRWLLRVKFINYLEFIGNYFIRILPRLLPVSLLKVLYRISRVV